MVTKERRPGVAATLFGRARREILFLLYGSAGEAFYLRQIARETGVGLGPVQRELKKLASAGLVLRTEQGRQAFYQANPVLPVYRELRDLMTRLKEDARRFERAEEHGPLIFRRFNVSERRLAEFCRKHHLRRLSFFGSVLRQDFKPASDIDILAEFEPGRTPGFLKLADIEAELSTLLRGRRIDLRTPQDLSPYFRERAVKEAEVQYAAPR
jgi:predicted nucleotidyltransferase